MLGNAQLLCEKGGVSVFLLSLHTGDTLFIDVCVYACIMIFAMCVFTFKNVRVHAQMLQVVGALASVLICFCVISFPRQQS